MFLNKVYILRSCFIGFNRGEWVVSLFLYFLSCLDGKILSFYSRGIMDGGFKFIYYYDLLFYKCFDEGNSLHIKCYIFT